MCLWSTKNTQGPRISNSEEVREGCMEEETLEPKEYKLTREEERGGRGRSGMRVFQAQRPAATKAWRYGIERDVNDSERGKQVCLAGAHGPGGVSRVSWELCIRRPHGQWYSLWSSSQALGSPDRLERKSERGSLSEGSFGSCAQVSAGVRQGAAGRETS